MGNAALRDADAVTSADQAVRALNTLSSSKSPKQEVVSASEPAATNAASEPPALANVASEPPASHPVGSGPEAAEKRATMDAQNFTPAAPKPAASAMKSLVKISTEKNGQKIIRYFVLRFHV